LPFCFLPLFPLFIGLFRLRKGAFFVILFWVFGFGFGSWFLVDILLFLGSFILSFRMILFYLFYALNTLILSFKQPF